MCIRDSCKHRARTTYEFPGGHREPGERILDTAKRELYEETGATDFEITPVCCLLYTSFREMRRKRQLLPQEQALEILENGTSGVLALSGDGGYPYAVPMSYVYNDGKIYFHCAKAGHKIDAIRSCDKASFCVTGQDNVVPGEYTTYFRSAIAFGRIRVIEDDAEKRSAIECLAAKYTPDDEKGRMEEIDKEYRALCMLEFVIEHLTEMCIRDRHIGV